MDAAWFNEVSYWHWWVLGAILLMLEIFVPGAFLLWLGFAAGLVGLLLLVLPDLAWAWQVLVFALFSVAAILIGRAYLERNPIESDQPALNRRGEQYVGRVFTLDRDMVDGAGRIRVDDTTWKVNGPDCPAGTKVKVTGVNGTLLQVKRAE